MTTRFTRKIALGLPFVSSPMGTLRCYPAITAVTAAAIVAASATRTRAAAAVATVAACPDSLLISPLPVPPNVTPSFLFPPHYFTTDLQTP